ncbi:MAG TPA: RNA polymerase sigma factor [Planctomycetota bacterium]|nr:RNA polymerase sigma factor [Planctomycetota bacterium]
MTEAALPSDEALTRSSAHGDRGAFAELFRRNQRQALAVAIGLLGNRTDAEEAVQDAFVRALERLQTIREPSRFSAWFTGILYRVCLELRRTRRRRVPGRAEISTVLASEAASRVVEEALALEDEFRDILVLVYLEGLSLKEAALALEISEANAKVRVHRARRILRERLGAKGEAP